MIEDHDTIPDALARRAEPASAPSPAAVLRMYSNVPAMLRAVAYAEARALMLAWARATVPDPIDLCRQMAMRALEGKGGLWHPSADAFGCHVQTLVRGHTAAMLFRQARRLGPPPWDGPLGGGQLGSVAGIEIIFHHAGEQAGSVRAHDPRVLAAAVTLTDQMRQLVRRRVAIER